MVTAPTSRSPGHAAPPLIPLSWSHFVVLVAVAGMLATLAAMALAPDLYEHYARHAIKRFEGEFGFVTGTLTVSDPTGAYTLWGITAVTPEGSFAKAGFREGDVPLQYHGYAASWLYGALIEASRGNRAEIAVYSVRDFSAGSLGFRRISIARSR